MSSNASSPGWVSTNHGSNVFFAGDSNLGTWWYSNAAAGSYPITPYNVQIPGTNPAFVAKAPDLNVSLGQVTNVPVSLTLSHGGYGVLGLGEVFEGATIDAYGPNLTFSAGQEGPAIQVTQDAVSVFRPTMYVPGMVSAGGFGNLINSFLVASPILPPSAAALNDAFVTLCNLFNLGGVLAAAESAWLVYATSCNYYSGGGSNWVVVTSNLVTEGLSNDVSTYSNGWVPPVITSNLVPYWYGANLGSQVAIPPSGSNPGYGFTCPALTVFGPFQSPTYLGLVQNVFVDADQYTPASAYAVYGAISTLSNATFCQPPFTWVDASNGQLLATLDSNGVFTPTGGFSNLPYNAISSSLNLVSSNTAASSAALAVVYNNSVANGTFAVTVSKTASNIAVAASNAVLFTSNAAFAASNYAFAPSNLSVSGTLQVSGVPITGNSNSLNVPSLSAGSYIGIVQNLGVAPWAVQGPSNLPPSAMAVTSALATLDSIAVFGSNASSFSSNSAPSVVFSSNASSFSSNSVASALWGSNAAYFASNAATYASNSSVFGIYASNSVIAATSNASVAIARSTFASNGVPWASNTAYYGCNGAVFSSNASVFASNSTVFASNASSFASNASYFASNLAPTVSFASNASSFSSNVVVLATPMASFASNAAYWGSNEAYVAFGTSTWASNAAFSGSNAGNFASNVSVWVSNLAIYESNSGAATSNLAFSLSNPALLASNLSYSLVSPVTWTSNSEHSTSNLAFGMSNVAYFGSNAAYVALGFSNSSFAGSNAAYAALASATFGCNAGVFGSNSVGASTFASNASSFASNASVFGSNSSVISSNTATFSSNASVFSSNASVFSSNASVFSSNSAVFSSNASFFLSNASFFSSNASVFSSNASVFGSNASVFSSNSATVMSNAFSSLSNSVAGLGVTSSSLSNSVVALGIASTFESNAAVFGSNTSIWTSNLTILLNSNSSVLSSAGLFSSNAAVFGSNASAFGSNLAQSSFYAASFSSNASTFGSNASRFASNAAVFGSNTSIFSSNASLFASNVSVYASNEATLGVAVGSYASNNSTWSSNLLTSGVIPSLSFASNAAWFGSNVSPIAAFASNISVWSSNAASWASNTGYAASNAANFASNVAVWSSNTYPGVIFASNQAVINSNASTFASNLAAQDSILATFGSNAGAFGSNAGGWSSNVTYATSNQAFNPSFVRSFSGSNAVTGLYLASSSLSPSAGVSATLCNAQGQSVALGVFSAAAGAPAASLHSTMGADLGLRADPPGIAWLTGGSFATNTTALTFPPTNGGLSSAGTLCNVCYGFGQYSTASSSASSSSNAAWLAFSGQNPQGTNAGGTSWSSAPSYYSTGGTYGQATVNSPSTTADGGSNTYLGEWIQLSVPNVLTPTSYTVVPQLTLSDSQPVSFAFLGSYDGGNTWKTLDSNYANQTGLPYVPSSSIITVAIGTGGSNIPISSVRLVVTRVTSSQPGGTLVPVSISAMSITASPTVATLAVGGSPSAIVATGNVGMGTTTPQQQLDVRGYAVVSKGIGVGLTNPSFQLQLSQDSAAKPSTNTWTVYSDKRLKDHLGMADLERCYEIVKTLPLTRFAWKEGTFDHGDVPDRTKLGWYAQDVLNVFPKSVTSHGAFGMEDCLTMNSDQIIAALYGTVQLLQRKVEALTKRMQ